MDVMHARCCGLDVHKATVVACVLTGEAGGRVRKEVRTFGTMTGDLRQLATWLAEEQVTHVGMESTGVYWKPVYTMLEGQFELVVANAQHVKAIPGKKTDRKDAEWLADLLRHGLMPRSFIPPTAQQQVRELTRYRMSLTQEHAAEANRLQKVLEGANIKLASVASDILGVSCRAMLQAMIAGEEDPAVLAGLAKGRMEKKRAELVRALEGRLQAHHRFLLAEQLRHLEALEAGIERVGQEIEERLRPFEAQMALADSIPGIAQDTAQVLAAEVGVDMSRFPSGDHLASWAGMCPGNNESAGRRHSGKTRKGSPWLRSALVQAAWGAAHTKDTYLAAEYARLVGRRGKKRALVAVGHSILLMYHAVLSQKQPYHELGGNYFDERAKETTRNRLVHRLEKLGFIVTLESQEPPPLPAAA